MNKFEEITSGLALKLMSQKCYTEIFVKFSPSLDCIMAIVSKLLGFIIIAGSSIVKVPQIMKIWNNHSAQGISFLSILTDLYAITVASSYSFLKGFPFSAYGEGILLGAQTVTIAAQTLFYNVSSLACAAFVAFYGVICYYITSGLVPTEILWKLQATSLPILLFGKLAQAFSNYKNKGTGQLSAVTCTMLLFGSLSRILTSFQETGDFILILTYVLASLGNAILVGQFIYYRGSTKPTSKPKKKKDGKKTQ